MQDLWQNPTKDFIVFKIFTWLAYKCDISSYFLATTTIITIWIREVNVAVLFCGRRNKFSQIFASILIWKRKGEKKKKDMVTNYHHADKEVIKKKRKKKSAQTQPVQPFSSPPNPPGQPMGFPRVPRLTRCYQPHRGPPRSSIRSAGRCHEWRKMKIQIAFATCISANCKLTLSATVGASAIPRHEVFWKHSHTAKGWECVSYPKRKLTKPV